MTDYDLLADFRRGSPKNLRPNSYSSNPYVIRNQLHEGLIEVQSSIYLRPVPEEHEKEISDSRE